MTKEEFNTWLDQHQDAFPEVTEWLFSIDPDETKCSDKRRRLLAFWAEALNEIHFEDAIACTRKMVAGLVEHPNRFELSRLPATIVKNTPHRIKPLGKVTAYNPQTGEVR